MPMKTRVAIVVSHPIQHYVHLYRALAAHPAIDLRVIYASDIGSRRYFDRDMNVEIAWETDLLSGYDYTVLPESPRIQASGFWSVNNPSIAAALASFQPDAVQIHGYAQLTMLRALAWCRAKRVPVLLSSDSSLLFRRSWPRRMAKQLIVRTLMSNVSGVLVTGDRNAEYYKHYGVREDRMFRCPFTVDERLLSRARQQRDDIRKTMREKFGIPEHAFLLLFVGKLIPLKRTRDILESLLLLRDELGAENISCFLAGDGPLRAELQRFAADNDIPAIFGGFINVDQLPSIYAMADALVFASDREAYGLAAREAICVGLPLIISDQIGCVGKQDAARPGDNAIVFPAGDAARLAQAIATLLDDVRLRNDMAAASLRIAAEMDAEASVAGYVSAIEAVTQGSTGIRQRGKNEPAFTKNTPL